jgi:aspartyl-tRNA(Asn)/glutamyl-tRNA(Gln) amidotransferase subunit A
VIDFLQEENFFLLGKAILDEFACGGTGLHANTGPIYNPIDPEFITGGSSSGASWAVSRGLVPFSLGHDTGDSIRRPASYCGVIGFKPSYGLISRYGVIPMSSSLDTVGIISESIEVIEKIFPIISKKDKRDLTTETKKKKVEIRKKKVAMFTNLERIVDKEVFELFKSNLEKIKKDTNFSVEEIELPNSFKESLQITYMVICCSELLSHLNSLQGVTYGSKDESEIMEKRKKNIGKIVKQRLMLGAYFLSKG